MFTLRIAKKKDLSVIRSLAERTWPLTYGDIISLEQINYMLSKMYSDDELLSQLQQGHVFLIASDEKEDVGFAGFSLINADEHLYKLHKLYVLPVAQGAGLGRLLLMEVLENVKQQGGQSLALNVNRENDAFYFYEKMGFQIKKAVDLDIGNGFYMNDYVMLKDI
jgi:GNAT superfamily N-acetyltransferase